VGEVEAEWEASKLSERVRGMFRIDGLGITGASFDKGSWEAKCRKGGTHTQVILFPILWWENGAGAG
jgi:hypothetical protein